MTFEKVLTKYQDIPEYTGTIDEYIAHGGYRALPKALRELQPAEVIEQVKRSGLRGRGGAGFPCGVKWGFIPKDSPKPKYLVCNCDESEPGTFKDRMLIEEDPHQLIEGMIISSYAIGSRLAFLYCRGEFVYGARVLERAIREATLRGYLGKNILGSGFDLDIHLHRGAGAYICGEETGLLESLEGKRGQPRPKPPFPAISGLYRSPTVVNNVETLCNVPHIVLRGAAGYMVAAREGASTGASVFDRILVLPTTSRAPSAATLQPPAAQPTPQFLDTPDDQEADGPETGQPGPPGAPPLNRLPPRARVQPGINPQNGPPQPLSQPEQDDRGPEAAPTRPTPGNPFGVTPGTVRPGVIIAPPPGRNDDPQRAR